MPGFAMDQRGIAFARALAWAQLTWALGGAALIFWYAVAARELGQFAPALPFLGAHFGFVIGLLLLLNMLAWALLRRAPAARVLLWAVLVYAAPLLLWQMLAISVLLAPPGFDRGAVGSILGIGAPVAFLCAGLGAFAAFQARLSLRRAIVAAALPASLCLFAGTAVLAAYVGSRAEFWHDYSAFVMVGP